MKIIVKKKGIAIAKPPIDIEKFFQMDNELIVNPKWMAFHRNQSEIKAINLLGDDLEPGVYEASLTWQYLNKNSNCWFPTKDIKTRIKQGCSSRLVYMKTYKPTLPSGTKTFSKNQKCASCKALLFEHEEKDGLCEYCNIPEKIQQKSKLSMML